MDILDVGKESAYRRLRGEKSLSLEEIYKLSLESGFSLDEILGNEKANTLHVNHIGSFEESPESNILKFLRHHEKHLELMLTSEKTEFIITMNHLLNTMLVGSDELFRFIYYRWMHQMKEVPLNYHFADQVIPAEIKNLCIRINQLQQKINKITLIIDKNIHLNLIKEMQYFYARGILNESELVILKEQYLRYMDYTEKIFKRGHDTNGNAFEIYLSMLNISSNTSYAIWDDKAESTFWYHFGYPMYTQDKGMVNRHKHWINSLKKYSTVITQSNELQQADFFNEQRRIINNISDKLLL